MHDFFRERPIRRRSSLFEKMQIRQARIDLLGNRRAVTQRSDPQFRIEQRAPSIVALLNQGSSTNRQIVARTNSNASSLPQLYKTAPAHIQKVETQMTKTDSIVNIADLINKCSDVMPSVLFCKGYKMTTQSNEDVTRQLGDLQKILNFVQQPGGLHKIGPRNLNSFLSMIQSHIFHPLPEVEHRFTFCDVVPTITVLDWPVIDTCYSIFLTVLKSLDGQILASLINQKFLMNLIAMLKSPDKREQNAVANLTFSIIEFNPRLTSTAIDALTNHLQMYINGEISFLGIETALKIIRQLFNFPKAGIYIDPLAIVKNYIIPLFNTPFAQEFQQALSSLCGYIYNFDHQVALYALKYLYNHWPIANATKTSLFLEQIGVISKSLKKTDQITAEMVFKRIIESLQTDNYKIINSTLTLCSNLQFYSFYLEYMKMFVPQLLAALTPLQDHWNEEVHQKAPAAVQIVTELYNNMSKMKDYTPMLKSGNQHREDIWNIIKEKALKP